MKPVVFLFSFAFSIGIYRFALGGELPFRLHSYPDPNQVLSFDLSTFQGWPLPAVSPDLDSAYTDWKIEQNIQAIPFWAQWITIQFGSRKVRLNIVASTHNSNLDEISQVLSHLGTVPPFRKRLFVEQGSMTHVGGVHDSLRELLGEQFPLRNFFAPSKWDFCDDSTYGKAAHFWGKCSGDVINFDLAANFSKGAGTFARDQKVYDLFIGRQKDLLNFLFRPDSQRCIDQIVRDQGAVPISNRRIESTSLLWELARERYMRHTLYHLAQDGDVVLAHPYHIQAIFSPEIRIPPTQ